MKWNLRNRIILPTIGLIILLTVAVSLVAFVASRAMLRSSMDQQLERVSKTTLVEVEHWVENQQQALQVWASESDVLQALEDSPEAAKGVQSSSQTFAQAKKLYGCMEAINLVNDKGLIVAGADQELVGKLNVAERSYFKDAIAGQIAISDVMASRVTGRPVVAVAVPVRVGKGVRGVVFSILDLTWFSDKFISKLKLLQTGYVYMYDEKGLTLAHPDKKNILKKNIGDQEWGKEMLKLRNGELDYTEAGVDKRVIFHTSELLHWGIAVTVPHAEMNAPVRHMVILLSALGLGALALGIVIMLLTARSITRPIHQATASLLANAAQTTESASQVSAASQSLAEGSSEQAASLEETSSSLEQMSSMTRQNSESAEKANQLAKQARAAADAGSNDMEAMNAAMQAIKTSSDDIAKIIKTIDEIAFQTNILALNAAVEAARAGEAGMGFAVVADEVRNLAQRCAQSAKETSTKIEAAISKTAQGVQISTKVTEKLQEIVTKVRQVDDLITEVTSASNEQSQGISQVNVAVSQMDKVTQSNAACAEESASASQELSAQADTLKQAVADLLHLVDGAKSARNGKKQMLLP